MKCNCCGEELGNAKICPVCGAAAPERVATVTGQATVAAPVITPKSSAEGGVDVYEKNIDAILEITCVWQKDGEYVGCAGSGFLISRTGYAVTNTHVVTDDDFNAVKHIEVKLCGQKIPASVVKLGDNKGGSGDGVDLALIKLKSVPASAGVVTFADSRKIKNGGRVYVIGNAKGLGTCITEGIISDKLRENLIMTDCAVNHGNSGGPMFDADGNLIGVIVSGIDSAEGMNFSIPSITTLDFLKTCGITDVKKTF